MGIKMGALGDFLEVVYGPTNRFQTVRAVVRLWRDRNTAEQALRDGLAMGSRKAGGTPSGEVSRIWEADIRIWMDGQTRIRIEETRRRDGLTESSLVVMDGDRWWERDHQGHVEAGGSGESGRRGGPGLTDAKRHFFPDSLREFFVGLALELLGPARTAGRECIRVRAVPRPDDRLWPHWLPTGADEYELHADPERGAVLLIVAKFRGRVFETIEVTEVVFDEPLDPGLFTYEPRQGEQVRPADPIVEHLTLAAAVARMPFTVLVPTRLPDPNHAVFEVMYHPPRVNDSRPHLSLMYRGAFSLWVNQAAAPAGRDGLEWESVERCGRRMEISDPGPNKGKRIVRLEHLGTHVDIWSDLDRERLIDLAARPSCTCEQPLMQ
jgi:hypothetical protein